MNVKDKIAVVTGAGSGIGRALVEKFVSEGARQVVAVDINAASAQQTADDNGCIAMTVQDDEADGASATKAAAGDGMMEPEELADIVIEGLERESFLILPHPEVETYMQRKTADYDRWIKGMNRLHLSLTGE